jgi:hypothetical protein
VEHPSNPSQCIDYVYSEVNACDSLSEYNGHRQRTGKGKILDSAGTYDLTDPARRGIV